MLQHNRVTMAQRGATAQRPNGVTQGKIQPFKLVLLGLLFHALRKTGKSIDNFLVVFC